MSKNNENFDLRSIVQIALLAALTFVATSIIKIPSPSGTGYVNLGDALVFTSAILLGGKKGALAAGIGGFLSDALGGYLIYAPFTFVIKAVMALIVGLIAFRANKGGRNPVYNGAAFIAAGIWEVIAYFGAGIIIYALTVSAVFNTALVQSIADIPGNIVQAAVGAVIAVPLALLLTKSGLLEKINNKAA